ncbi:MAG: FAD-dependent oxidoreductase [Bacteroidia bacterium]
MMKTNENPTLWEESVQPGYYKKLDKDIQTEVLVIGGGISGITTAYNLQKAGKKVTLIEQATIGSGQTARTTAHLTYCLDIRYFQLIKQLGIQNVRTVANSHMASIEWMDRIIRHERINCNFKRISGYLFSIHSAEMVQKEYLAMQDLGIIAEMINYIPGLKEKQSQACICFPEQAQFHALKYLKGLTNAALNMGVHIYNHTAAGSIQKNTAKANGYTITAEYIVITANTALNTPELNISQTKFRSYVIGIKIPKGQLPYSLWWEVEDSGNEKEFAPYHYARLENFDDLNDLFIVGGEDREIEGTTPDENLKFGRLLEWASQRFAIKGKPEYQWSGTISYSNDGLPFIGRYRYNNHYIISGDSGSGINYATIGSRIITDSICGVENNWEAVYSPSRIVYEPK